MGVQTISANYSNTLPSYSQQTSYYGPAEKIPIQYIDTTSLDGGSRRHRRPNQPKEEPTTMHLVSLCSPCSATSILITYYWIEKTRSKPSVPAGLSRTQGETRQGPRIPAARSTRPAPIPAGLLQPAIRRGAEASWQDPESRR